MSVRAGVVRRGAARGIQNAAVFGLSGVIAGSEETDLSGC
jgi:hypothetical protein